jgi:predicted nucleic acid-binding protein
VPFVLDASVIACWAFEDENHVDADQALALLRTDEAVVPSLLWFEVRNILVMNERRKRLTETDTVEFLRGLSSLRILVDHTPDEEEVLRLARTHRLTVYDSAYLELAKRKACPLATLDADLAKAAGTEGVRLIGAVGSA